MLHEENKENKKNRKKGGLQRTQTLKTEERKYSKYSQYIIDNPMLLSIKVLLYIAYKSIGFKKLYEKAMTKIQMRLAKNKTETSQSKQKGKSQDIESIHHLREGGRMEHEGFGG